LLVLRRPDLPFMDYGGTDHIPRELLDDESRFARIQLEGRPMGLRIGSDDRTVYVANYLENSVQVVDLDRRQLMRSISLGGPSEPSLVRRGEAIFYDARRSLDQWYSCHTCHYEGGPNAVVMDTFNDRSPFSFKSVLPLHNVTRTAPWTWHGWQADFRDAMAQSLTSTMVGPVPSEQDIDALIAYLESLRLPPNPFRGDGGQLDEAAVRGERIFHSDQANCASCHTGEYLTDGQIHDVGTGTAVDRLDGFNTPSLQGVYRKVILLHDGRETSLEVLLTGPHSPSIVSGNEPLTEAQVRDLVAYLRSL
jgi:cytochrome c peroxidase